MERLLGTERSLTFTFDRTRLEPLAASLHDSFVGASPFPHVVVDDFLPEEVIDDLIAEFPEPGSVEWHQFDKPAEVKLALDDTAQMGPVARHVLAEFNGQVFTEFLERLTGIDHLVPDPHYKGGGMHQILAGGFLKVHADFNRHPGLLLDRRLNVLLYLNRDWDPSWGGELELWEQDMSRAARKVVPVANRMVCFATTDFSNHGHPDPLRCPPDRARRSMALYYYTNGRPQQEVSDPHTTLFKERPGEEIDLPAHNRFRAQAKAKAKAEASSAAAPPATSAQRPAATTPARRPAVSGLRRYRPTRAQVKRWVPPAVLDIVRARRR